MLPFDTIALFFAASVLLSLSPGPDNVFVLIQSMTHGVRAGVVITLGLCTGLLVHSAAVILGVAALFQTSEMAFTVLKLTGAAYLIYLAYGALKASPEKLTGDEKAIPLSKLYLRGIVMNVTNPKVSIFFLAFLPQFVDPSLNSNSITSELVPVSLQMLQLSVIFIIAALLVFNIIAVLAGFMGQKLTESEGIQRWLNRISGVVFIGLAMKLALSEQN